MAFDLQCELPPGWTCSGSQCRVFPQSLDDTEQRYRELQMKVDSLGGDTGGLDRINQKAKDIKKEAEDLLNKASKGMEQLRSE